MLSRIANSLFWMGRYLERAEYNSRYSMVHYFMLSDVPQGDSHEPWLKSVLDMQGVKENYISLYPEIEDKAVLNFVCIDDENPFSIKNSVQQARENARGARDKLLTELWEAINVLYHHVNTFPDMEPESFDRFTKGVRAQCAIINGYIDNTLIRNEVWSIIKIGQHVERCSLISRIMLNKTQEIKEAKTHHLGDALENYLCITMLQSAESFDMSRAHFHRVPNTREALSFLIFNPSHPKSLVFNLESLQYCLKTLGLDKEFNTVSVTFDAGKLLANLQFMTMEEVERDVHKFLKHILDKIYSLAAKIEIAYLSY